MKFFLMSSFSVLKIFSMATFNIPAIYRNLFVAEFSKCLAVPDCNALLILSLFIRLAAVLYSPSKCCLHRWIFYYFFDKIKQPMTSLSTPPSPSLVSRCSSLSIHSPDCNICRQLIPRNTFISHNKGLSVRQHHPFLDAFNFIMT